MPCHFGEEPDAMTSSTPMTVWTCENIQNSDIPNGMDFNSNIKPANLEEVPIFQNMDFMSLSQKRKLLDREKEDFEERFFKIQRSKQVQKIAARANLVVGSDSDDSDEESRIYEQINWIEKEGIMNIRSYEKNNLNNVASPIVLLPRFKLKEDRCQLLKISMAKIQGVEDPEVYLRRSVLINNTVKRLQGNGSIEYRPVQLAEPLNEGVNEDQNQSMNWEVVNNTHSGIVCKSQIYSSDSLNYSPTSVLSAEGALNSTEPFAQSNTLYNSNFQLCVTSTFHTGNLIGTVPNEESPDYLLNRISTDDQRTNDSTVSLYLKQQSPMHMFSTQSCSSQFRTLLHDDCIDEYHDSSNSSILDSVVYRSLIASLET